jgi:hypothetical protein
MDDINPSFRETDVGWKKKGTGYFLASKMLISLD